MKIAVTGGTGNIGNEVLKAILPLDFVENVHILVRPKKANSKKIVEFCRGFPKKIKLFIGDMNNKQCLLSLIKEVDVVINLAAVIPPISDNNPKLAIECNEIGLNNLVDVLESNNPQALFIDMSSVAVYGNRNEKHPFVEVGDPLLISVGDIYALTKVRAEFRVLESKLDKWVILRESAVLHENLMKDNMKDGIMFHTCFNTPLEWISSKDTAVLLKNICIKYHNNELNYQNFYKKVFNVGNKKNRLTGYETFNEGFKMLGAGCESFFEPNFNVLRNFHGAWFRDSDKLNEMFNFQNDQISLFWDKLIKQNKIVTLGKFFPKKLIKKLVIERLFEDKNAPRYWINHQDEAKIKAYFINLDTFYKIPKTFEEFGLFCKQSNYSYIKNNTNYQRINLFFDINKKDEDIDIDDLINVAKAHNGKLLSSEFKKGDIYQQLTWETQDKEVFKATPYTILRAGHWYNPSYYKYSWEFDRLAKTDLIYKQVWLDSRLESENNIYYFDKYLNLNVKKAS